MAKPDGRVEAGQSLKRAISAQRWNDLCDAADIVHGRRGGVTAGAATPPGSRLVLPMRVFINIPPAPADYVYGPGTVVTFSRSLADGFRLIQNASNDDVFADAACFHANVLEPVSGDDTTYPYGQAFGVTLAGNQTIAPVVISGYAICRIHMIAPDHQFAKGAVLRSLGETADNLRGCLESTECGCDGTAKILSFESGNTYPEIRWGMVVL